MLQLMSVKRPISEQEVPKNEEEKAQTKKAKTISLHIEKASIPTAEDTSIVDAIEADDELQSLGLVVYDHRSYEQNVIHQVEHEIEQIEKSQQKNVDKSSKSELSDSELVEDKVDADLSQGEEVDEEQIAPVDIEECFDDDVDRIIEAPDSCNIPVKSWNSGDLKLASSSETVSTKKRVLDDGDLRTFKNRIESYKLHRANLNLDANEYENEMHKICDQLMIPRKIWDRLYKHQRESLPWLYELHCNLCGGILGDEMGLGKTIQIIAYLVALSSSKLNHLVGEYYPSLGPVLLVCPATVMHQWVAEFHKWWPPFRVAILHQTGTFKGSDKTRLIREIFQSNGILITSYQAVLNYHKSIVKLDWHYVILDEGHKIRNPEAQITHYCKLFTTPHRLILSGSPIQNNLRELWSLMDFIYPSKLGSLCSFMNNVAKPIRLGGYSNATEMQIQVSYKCTLMLRDTIKPYLLHRTKEGVQSNLRLPAKNEQVLFCKLTDKQREIYQDFIKSGVVREVSQGNTLIFAALVKIRKICNHPYLFAKSPYEDTEFDLSFFRESSKMVVVDSLLKLWKKQDQKVLLFTQSRQMLDLIEKYVQCRNYRYFRMDGETPIHARQAMIKTFNEDSRLFLFLLTTRVGGVGVNLTGANRVIIYDPDWNPCTDMQARERCWRIGQNRDVMIYRLLTVGTVEEKIYHRQIFKQYLTNRVLRDPTHRRFFKINDLHELFTLTDFNETSTYFSDSKVKLNRKEYANQQSTKGMITNSTKSKSLPKIPRKTNSEVNHTNVKVLEKSRIDLDEQVSSIELSEERKKELWERVRMINKLNFGSSSAEKPACDTNQTKNLDTEKCDTSSTSTSSNITVDQPSCSKVKDVKNHNEKFGIKFEGKRIRYLAKLEEFDEGTKKKKRKKEKNEEYLLSKLLGGSIHSVLQHDRIENVNIPDHYYIEREAEDFAKKSLADLQSEMIFRHQSDPLDSPPRSTSELILKNYTTSPGKISSASIIANLKNRFKYNCSSGRIASEVDSQSGGRHLENLEIMRELHRFIEQNGQPSTDQILAKFKPCIRPEQSAILRALLRHMADMIPGENRSNYWKLKPEFSSNSRLL